MNKIPLPCLALVSLVACSHNKSEVRSPTAVVPPPVATPAPTPPSPPNAVAATVQGCSLPAQFDDIFFEFDSYELTDPSRQTLQEIADCLLKNAGASITIAGNTDERGTTEYNLALGQERARVAHDYLIRLRVDPEQVKAISYGKSRPLVVGDSEEAWRKNRRDDFIVGH